MSDESYIVVIPNKSLMRERFLAGWNHAEALLKNGDSVQLSVGPSVLPITQAQRGFFHGPVLRQVSEQAYVPIFDSHGVDTGRRTRYVIKTWKHYFKERFLGFRFTYEDKMVLDKKTGLWRPSKKKTPIKELISTETLGPAKYAKFIDAVIDCAVDELGVEFEFQPSEREAVRYVSKRRKQPQPETSQ